MNGELLNILGSIARQKGIDREILVKAVESSLVSAARKSTEPIAQKKHINVIIDRENGSISAFAELTVVDDSSKATPDEITLANAKKIKPDAKIEDKINVDLTPTGFGRIAAQNAKQIIIQKIREAERDIIYEEFKNRVGDITMGTVRRRERGNIIVDLGRTEAILPMKEQCPEERYQIGNRIRAYISEVKTSPRGPEIILSRTHIGLVRRLFELEVPEISDGTVEIKGIVREPGFRCKVAVHSLDPKVDPIGACVGMRGSRIKNVVRELEKEKLDILRWDPDLSTYVANALNPAKVEEVIINEKEKKVKVRVADDQLSIAIGKRGQNVRLASRLTGQNIDVRKLDEELTPGESKEKPPKKTTAKEEPMPQETGKSGPSAEEADKLISQLGLSKKKVDILINAGFETIEKIASADISQLTALEGFGGKTVQKLKETVFELIKKKG